MANVTQFQLFPPVPKITISSSSPTPNFSKLHTSPSPVDALVKSPQAESVIIQIIEESDPEPKPDNVIIVESRSPSTELEREAAVPSSPISGHRPSIQSIPPPPPLPALRSISPNAGIDNQIGSSPTSPVQMRSMFPVYNESLPLSQQQYFPQRVTSLQRSIVSRDEYGPRVASPSRLDDAVGGLKTAPASVLDFPTDTLTLRETQYSSIADLERLWEATNGQDPSLVKGNFTLQMSRMGEATFNFGSTPSQPFYTLQTYNTNEISISRTHPRAPAKQVPILFLGIEPQARRLPPHDGLVTVIFPRLAAILAIEQSAELSERHQLAASERVEMEEDAIRRAAEQEACTLKWCEFWHRYELHHPAIGRAQNKAPHFAMSPTSPLAAQGESVLHITISSHAPGSSSAAATPPVIMVTNPLSSPALQQSSPADIRMSTIPNSDIDEPLASLDLGSMTLTISPAQILRVAPSLYAVDSIVSAMFAVAVGDEATNPIMADMESWDPSPKIPESVYCGSICGKSYTGSVLYATLAEREEAEAEARGMRETHLKDVKGKSQRKSIFGGKSKEKKKQKNKTQIIMGEFDLEKYGTYQAGSREGEQLPGPVRGALEALFLGLKFFVWILTGLVEVIAWLMVSLTRCLTSERF